MSYTVIQISIEFKTVVLIFLVFIRNLAVIIFFSDRFYVLYNYQLQILHLFNNMFEEFVTVN